MTTELTTLRQLAIAAHHAAQERGLALEQEYRARLEEGAVADLTRQIGRVLGTGAPIDTMRSWMEDRGETTGHAEAVVGGLTFRSGRYGLIPMACCSECRRLEVHCTGCDTLAQLGAEFERQMGLRPDQRRCWDCLRRAHDAAEERAVAAAPEPPPPTAEERLLAALVAVVDARLAAAR